MALNLYYKHKIASGDLLSFFLRLYVTLLVLALRYFQDREKYQHN